MRVDLSQQILIVGTDPIINCTLESNDVMFSFAADSENLLAQLVQASEEIKKPEDRNLCKKALVIDPNSFSCLALRTQLQMFGIESQIAYKADTAIQLI